jgi:flagellin
VNVTLGATTNAADTITAINAQTASMGIYAIVDGNTGGISIQSAGDFSLTGTASGGADGIFNNATATSAVVSAPDSSATATGAAQAAITAISNAVSYLGLVQGKVGTGQNKLQYSIQLAQSQLSNFAAAESRIRDADVAAEAANLTKAQVLQQASLAAMAQANSAPQAVLSLLRG